MSPALIAYVAVLALLAGMIVGVLPALKATGKRVHAGLQHFASRGASMQLGRTWTALVVLQVAITVAALPAAMYRASESFRIGMRGAAPAARNLVRGTLAFSRDDATGDGGAAARAGVGDAKLHRPDDDGVAETRGRAGGVRGHLRAAVPRDRVGNRHRSGTPMLPIPSARALGLNRMLSTRITTPSRRISSTCSASALSQVADSQPRTRYRDRARSSSTSRSPSVWPVEAVWWGAASDTRAVVPTGRPRSAPGSKIVGIVPAFAENIHPAQWHREDEATALSRGRAGPALSRGHRREGP